MPPAAACTEAGLRGCPSRAALQCCSIVFASCLLASPPCLTRGTPQQARRQLVCRASRMFAHSAASICPQRSCCFRCFMTPKNNHIGDKQHNPLNPDAFLDSRAPQRAAFAHLDADRTSPQCRLRALFAAWILQRPAHSIALSAYTVPICRCAAVRSGD